MEFELTEFFAGREVELRTYEDLGRHFRDEVRAESQPLHRSLTISGSAMIEAAHTALTFAEGKARADLERDEMLQLALVKLVEIMREAAEGVGAGGRAVYPRVAWAKRQGCATVWCITTSTSTSTSSGRPSRRTYPRS